MAATSNRATTRWWWVRHAPVDDGGYIYGQRDLPCDCTDEIVFQALARDLPRDAVWLTSNLQRTRLTAEAIAHAAEDYGAHWQPVAVPALAEQHLGDWQGRNRAEFMASPERTHAFWFSPPSVRAPNGESFEDLANRVRGAVEQLSVEHAGRDIVAVAHGGTIKAAIAAALRLDLEAALTFTIDNCSITRLDHLGGAPEAYHWRVLSVNHRPWAAGSAPAAAIKLMGA
ncbi:histidine phosphatase family protein [Chelatococcus reniformis]|uniref:Phosphoglycerate kinase n=1 Tax=Chelatococcus reniformis TaxID=1494448 RepID=A0A916X7M9_9HYPH|nr:histidine phosphatase family protein [Chelatococcus reniformis]GGC51889.1 phosphoglycerate kinase [Chelatococcus reniformis]